ncbi:MAG: phosphoribosylamine--glycine ligase [Chitinispirillaceae bacterium]|nr:phosphoribosylamine--glycine ligase [Chitinispirillaceae bacterium]
MNSVLIVGSGGREHALLKAFLRSNRPLCMYAWPGNPGMERDGCMLVDKPVKNWKDLADWAKNNGINLTVVGPEIPLVEGIVDTFRESGLAIFGPAKGAAAIEGSKAFSKDLMKKYGIPTAAYELFTDKEAARRYLCETGAPVVIKVSGLAAGKGAIVCDTMEEAETALTEIFDENAFGDAGSTVVIEEKMVGEELSVFVITDGKEYRILPTAQDHKPVGDGDTGPNTGGMGAYSPAPIATPDLMTRIEKEIIRPTLTAMVEEEATYQGVLYVGLMITAEGPKVVEYNCRFGDPETQAVLPLVTCDWYELFLSAASGRLTDTSWSVMEGYCACVVLASKGYPGAYEKRLVISGLDDSGDARDNTDIYHSGTAVNDEEQPVTNGGRVLAVSSWAATLEDAIARAYEGVARISFKGKQFRTDIGAKGVARLKTMEQSV